ncbi:unnamed protein product [Paramecium octaurelia]|uniref:Tetratricopeptide repeat protein n=1 Tax=Paramecium octaurelia TaxID=43137 RepID=A0A8S1TKX3_PAROT|nr:unnamed protein product [Paramecium octaurelia]
MKHQNMQIQQYNGIPTLLIIMSLKIEEALKYFDEAIQRNPEGSKYYAEKADTLRAVNRTQEALKFCNIALSIDPYNHNYIVIKILTLLQMNRWDESSQLYEQLQKICPNKQLLEQINRDILIQMEQFNQTFGQQ